MLAEGDLITVKQALALVPIGRSTLYSLVARGALPSYRVGATGGGRGRVLVARRDLQTFIANSRQGATRAPVRVDADAVLARVRRREGT